MGNIYSLYQNYKNEYDELEDKYNKLKVKHDSDKTKIDVLMGQKVKAGQTIIGTY